MAFALDNYVFDRGLYEGVRLIVIVAELGEPCRGSWPAVDCAADSDALPEHFVDCFCIACPRNKRTPLGMMNMADKPSLGLNARERVSSRC